MRKTIFDFAVIDDTKFEKDVRIIRVKFVIKIPSKHLMIRGGKLYAAYNESTGMWIQEDEGAATNFVMNTLDDEMSRVRDEYEAMGARVKVHWMWDADSGSMDRFIKFVTKQMPPQSFHQLNQKMLPASATTTYSDYVSVKLPYDIAPGDTSAFHGMFDKLFEEQLLKLQWSVGALLHGDMEDIEKFIVLTGEPGSGKGTWLDLVDDMFKPFVAAIDISGMVKSSNAFPLESLRNYPLIGIQFDGDLSKIEENTILNQIVSHETVELNLKNLSKSPARFTTFLYMGSNRPVKISEAKSGIIRRLIDVKPTGNLHKPAEYRRLKKQMSFEYGAIAYECLELYKEMGPNYYDEYVPVDMLAATNDFYDFIVDRYDEYVERDKVTQSEAWTAYKEYCEYSGAKQMPLRVMSAELRSYFREYQERGIVDGVRVRKLYSGFRADKFTNKVKEKGEKNYEEWSSESSRLGNSVGVCSGRDDQRLDSGTAGEQHEQKGTGWLTFKQQPSIFDQQYADLPAQYEVDYKGNQQPEKAWAKVTTKLRDLDTSKTHYVLGPSSLIFIDFDLKNEDGVKDFEVNRKAAESFPPTYAELSKSGGGIHLYYIYTGDVSKLAKQIGPDIEVKVCPEGKKSPIRRMLTLCNGLSIATISSGLPLKGDKKKVLKWEGIKDEQHLVNKINQCLRKEGNFGPHTSENIQEIKKALDDAYESGMKYDVSDLKLAVKSLANSSSHQKDICLKMVDEMHFASEEGPEVVGESEAVDQRPIVIDIEIYPPDNKPVMDPDRNPGLFHIAWKFLDAPVDTMIHIDNPTPWQVEELLRMKMIGFNIAEYDAPMLKGRAMGDGNARSYDRSYRMIQLNDPSAKPKGSAGLAYIDVYEIMKASGEGMSLKMFENKMLGYADMSDEELRAKGFTDDQMKAVNLFRTVADHEEMSIPWDQPAPKEMWPKIADYCGNDVIATEAAYWFYQSYINARKAQKALVNNLHPECKVELIDKANTLTKRAIFGGITKPQAEFNYRDLSRPVGSDRYEEYVQKFGPDYQFRVWNVEGLPEFRDYIPGEVLPEGWSILPFFPGYTFNPYAKKSEQSTFLDDHGGEGGRTYSVPGMYLHVWDGDIASQYPHSIIAEVLFGPKYTKIFAEIVQARIAVKHKDFETAGKLLNGALKPYLNAETSKDLAQALKIIINSVYGLTSASFDNEFRDPRNIDNIVAKRGNLFMLVLKNEVEKRGYKVCHIKTDSIKIVEADKYIQDFVKDFGHEYGYTFETEGEFDKFVLLNDAAYVAHEKNSGEWITKAKQFQEPYVRKKLFTKEPISVHDLSQTFQVSSGSAIFLDKNEGYPDVSAIEKEVTKIENALKKGKVPKGWEGVNEGELQEYLKELKETEIPAGHNYQFVGRVGTFLPVKDGYDGGYLYRVKDGKNYAVSGTSGYRWLETEYAINKYGMDCINMDYFSDMADQAREDISKYVDVDWFVESEIRDLPKKEGPLISVDVVPADFMNIPEGIDADDIPFE